MSLRFRCTACNATFLEEMGLCTTCGSLGTVIAESSPEKRAQRRAVTHAVVPGKAHRVLPRWPSGLEPWDRSLGGDDVVGYGPIRGFTYVLGGDPGIGKSTLLTQLAGLYAALGFKVLYVAGEEGHERVLDRAIRLGATHPKFVTLEQDFDVDLILKTVATDSFDILIVDSIQSVHCEGFGAVGAPKQIKEATRRIIHTTQHRKLITFLLGHVTSDGLIAGGNHWKHMVDAITYFEQGEHAKHRIIRHAKNRGGPTDQSPVFLMTGQGLVPIPETETSLLSVRDEPVVGAIQTLVPDGTGHKMVELDLLAVPMEGEAPRRIVTGLEKQHVQTVLAALRHHVGDSAGAGGMGLRDLYVQMSGVGVITSSSVDLALALGLYGFLYDIPTSHLCAVGHVKLTGEIAQRDDPDTLQKEAERRGLRCIAPPDGTHVEDVVRAFLSEYKSGGA